MVLGYSESGHQINDEKITAQQQVTLAHDNFFDVEIWTGPNKTGTKLVEGTDYVLSKFDARYNAWNEIRFLAHIGETLYVTYKSRGDYIKAEHVNDLKSSKAEKDLSNVDSVHIVNKIKEIHGAGSGIDSDLLDGKEGDYYLEYKNFKTTVRIPSLLIYYGYPIAFKGLWEVNSVIDQISQYDYWVCGGGYQDPSHEYYNETVQIIQGVRERGTKVYGYIPLGNYYNFSIDEIVQLIQQWKTIGVDGIFLDEFGFDYGNDRQRQIDAVNACHDAGLPYIANAWVWAEVLCDDASQLPWPSDDWRYIQYVNGNPNNLPLPRTEQDAYLFENYAFDHQKAQNQWDLHERLYYALEFRKQMPVKMKFFGVAVFGEKPPGTPDMSLYPEFKSFEEAKKYVFANAYLHGLDAIGIAGYTFGANGKPLEFSVKHLPKHSGEPEEISWNLNVGEVSRRFGKVTVFVKTTDNEKYYKIFDTMEEITTVSYDEIADVAAATLDYAKSDLSNVSDSTVLNKIKNVDGSGSGLDADTVDGKHASDFVQQDTAGNVSIAGTLDVAKDTTIKGINVLKAFPPAIPEGSTAYFKKQLIDEIIGIKPNGYDGSTVTSYGLRTSSDNATLVVTERKDDVPFPGVTSFAVEEGTTNLLSNPSFETYTGTSGVADNWGRAFNSTVTPNYSVESIGYNSNRSQKIEITNSTGLGDAIVYQWHTLTIGSTYTLSAYVRGNVTGTCVGFVRIAPKLGDRTTINQFITYFVPTNQWQRVSVTATIPEETSYCEISVGLRAKTAGDIGTLYIDNVQLEEKPFATSFVDGTRPKGRLYIPLDKLGFNPAADEWVIAYWKKPFGTHDGLTGYNISAIGYHTADFSVGYIWWGKVRDSNTFRVDVIYNNRTVAGASYSTFVPNWYFNNWHFEVLIKTSDEIKYYVDGVLQCSLTLSYPLQAFTEGLYVGGFKNYACNNLIANLLIAHYDPTTWTDEYIKFLYETQKPFFV